MSWQKWIDPADKSLGKAPILGPEGFTNADAEKLVKGASFAKPVYVGFSQKEANTKQAAVFVDFKGWRLCVVAHTHNTPQDRSRYIEPGNSYIPGWDGWSMSTPGNKCLAIVKLISGGTFPDDRYPEQI